MLEPFLSFLTFEKRYSPHTITSYRTDLRQFSAYLLEAYGIEDPVYIKHTHIRTWLVMLMQEGISNRSINRKISGLKTFFNYLKRGGKISKNPMLKIISPKLEKRLPEYVEENKLEKLFDTINEEETFNSFRDKLIVELLYTTGMRRMELIQLKPQDINFFNQTIKVLGKGAKERLIPLSMNLLNKLKRYQGVLSEIFSNQMPEYLFVSDKGKKMYPKLVYNIVTKYLGSVTTQKKRSPHILRHSFATHLSNGGADLNVIKELLGHSNLAATQVYTHNSIERLRKVYKSAHPKARKS